MTNSKAPANYRRRIAEGAVIMVVMLSMLYTASEFLGMTWLKQPLHCLTGSLGRER